MVIEKVFSVIADQAARLFKFWPHAYTGCLRRSQYLACIVLVLFVLCYSLDLKLLGRVMRKVCNTIKPMLQVFMVVLYYMMAPVIWIINRWEHPWFITWLIQLMSRTRLDVRKAFKDLRVSEKVNEVKCCHSHLMSANQRTHGDTAALIFAKMIGRSLYSISMSKSEEDTVRGSRYYYFAKDLQSKMRTDVLRNDEIVKLTDVDYYVDMPKIMDGHDIVVHTFVPEEVCGTAADSSYCVTQEDKIRMKVNGGAEYLHQLWDYDNDHIIVDHWWGSCVYLVEQKNVGLYKRLILLNCVRIVYGPLGWFISGNRLRRKRLTYGNLAYMKKLVGEGEKVKVVHNLGYLDFHTSANISDRAFMASYGKFKLAAKPNITDIERILRSYGEEDPAGAAVLLFELVQSGLVVSNSSILSNPVRMLPESYQTLAPLVHEDGKERHRHTMPPLLKGGFAPVSSYNNDKQCVEGRIKSVANKISSYPPFFWLCLNEFVEELIPNDMANSLVPFEFEQQYELFNRPTQRSLIESVKHMMFNDVGVSVKSFQKSELYGKVTSPRNISTLPMGHNFRLGQYAHVLSNNVLKQQEWYAFGKHPSVVEERIVELAETSDSLIPTDISKCDGSTGYIMACLMTAVFMRAFHRDYHDEILKLLKNEAHISGMTKNGLYYECDYNTLSGSSITAVRNGTINAYVNYVCLRFKLSRKEAYKMLGLYGGDDGMSRGVETADLEKTFAMVGMVLKAEKIIQGEAVPFLGRLYLDPWSTKESICDVKRQLSKIHTTVSPKVVPLAIAAHRKAAGYAVTDYNTPIIKDWILLVNRIYPDVDQVEYEKYLNLTKNDSSYWSRFETPFTPLVNVELALSVIAKDFGVDVSNIVDYVNAMGKCNSVKDIENSSLHTMLYNEEKYEVTSVVDGKVVEGVMKDHQKIVSTNAATPSPAIENVLKKTRKIKPPIRDCFNKPPKEGLSLKDKKKLDVVKTCKFIANKEPCPFKNCKFYHPKVVETAKDEWKKPVVDDTYRPVTPELKESERRDPTPGEKYMIEREKHRKQQNKDAGSKPVKFVAASEPNCSN